MKMNVNEYKVQAVIKTNEQERVYGELEPICGKCNMCRQCCQECSKGCKGCKDCKCRKGDQKQNNHNDYQ